MSDKTRMAAILDDEYYNMFYDYYYSLHHFGDKSFDTPCDSTSLGAIFNVCGFIRKRDITNLSEVKTGNEISFTVGYHKTFQRIKNLLNNDEIQYYAITYSDGYRNGGESYQRGDAIYFCGAVLSMQNDFHDWNNKIVMGSVGDHKIERLIPKKKKTYGPDNQI